MTFHRMFVNMIFSSVWVAEWPPFGKELLTRLTICSLCFVTSCYFSYLSFFVLGRDLGSDCSSPWSLHTFTYKQIHLTIEILLKGLTKICHDTCI